MKGRSFKELLLSLLHILSVVVAAKVASSLFRRQSVDSDDPVLVASARRRSTRLATREHYVNKVSAKHYKAMIDKFRDTFDSHLKGFLGALQNRTAERGSAGGAYVQNLAHRLDYNEFYTKMYGFDVTDNWGT